MFLLNNGIPIFFFFHLYKVVIQSYITEAENEYIIRGNSAVMKCKIPSYVGDFVFIEAWISDKGETYKPMETQNMGNFSSCNR